MMNSVVILSSLCLLFGGLALVVTAQSGGDKLVLDVYYSAFCGDSKRFISIQIPTLIDDFVKRGLMDINLVSFGKARYVYNNETELFKFACQFGDDECVSMAYQNCMINKYPKFLDHYGFINCTMFSGRAGTGLNSTEQARLCARELSIDFDELRECATSRYGNTLSYLSGVRTQLLDPNLNYVPWVVLDNKHTNCIQTVGEFSALVLACNEFPTNSPLRPSFCRRTYQYEC